MLPSTLAMGRINHMIDRGKLPGAEAGTFYPLLFRDSAHPNEAAVNSASPAMYTRL